jgi:hypothetical protein
MQANAELLLGRLALAAGDATEAERYIHDALGHLVAKGFALNIPECLDTLAAIAATQENFEEAARLLGAAAAGRQRLGIVRFPPEPEFWTSVEHTTQEALGPDGYDTASPRAPHWKPTRPSPTPAGSETNAAPITRLGQPDPDRTRGRTPHHRWPHQPPARRPVPNHSNGRDTVKLTLTVPNRSVDDVVVDPVGLGYFRGLGAGDDGGVDWWEDQSSGVGGGVHRACHRPPPVAAEQDTIRSNNPTPWRLRSAHPPPAESAAA